MGKEKTGKVSETVAVPEWVMWVMGKVDEMAWRRLSVG